MHEPAAREDGRSTVGAQQSHHLAAGDSAIQTGGALPQNRRITADSFRALSARLQRSGRASLPAVPPAIDQPIESIIIPGPAPAAAPDLPELRLEPVLDTTTIPVEPPPPAPVPARAPEPAGELEVTPAVPESEAPPAELVVEEAAPPTPEPVWRNGPGQASPPPVVKTPAAIPDEPQSIADILSAVFGQGAASWTLPEAPALQTSRPAPRSAILRDLPPAAPELEQQTGPAGGEDTGLPEPARQPAEPEEIAERPVAGESMPAELVSDENHLETVAPQPIGESQPVAEEPQPIAATEPEQQGAPAPEPVPEPARAAPEMAVPPAPPELPAARRESHTSLLRKRSDAEADPFAEAQIAAAVSSVPPVEIGEPDPQAGETAKSLLDIMSASATVSQPQERALAADTLLRLIPRVPEKNLIALVERVAIMETPPPMLVTRLIRDPRADVAGPLLEKASHIPDRDLITVVYERDLAKLRLIARRRHLSPALVDALIAAGDTSVLLTLVRNPGAAPSHEAFQALCDEAKIHHSLQAPLITRQDTPVPTAFELFWYLPPELRRFVLSRFLTDSENLNRILKIAKAAQGSEAKGEDTSSEAQLFPERRRVDDLMNLIIAGNIERAVHEMSELAQICEENAARIITDAEGEPLTIALKVIGMSRARFAEGIVALQQAENSTLRKDRNPSELQSIFDSMSFNKARVLLTYWDWLALKSGPYTRIAA